MNNNFYLIIEVHYLLRKNLFSDLRITVGKSKLRELGRESNESKTQRYKKIKAKRIGRRTVQHTTMS